MKNDEARKPEISVVVVVHNMWREAPRTLYSLSALYQRHIDADEYEVIVVDNGSQPALDSRVFNNLVGNFRLIRLDPAPPSPAHAINIGLAEAKGEIIGVMIDGARIVTPTLLHFARTGTKIFRESVVATLGWYVGFDHQRWAIQDGYNAAREDALLESIDWPNDGYRLFEIATLDGSSVDGWFSPIAESNALFLKRSMWDVLAGADERFDEAGGGLLNLDIFRRAVELPDAELVILLGEATFHQVHGGIATNSRYDRFSELIVKWKDQYAALRGHPWAPPILKSPTYLGTLPQHALVHFIRSAIEPVSTAVLPLGPSFDQTLWTLGVPPKPTDPKIAAVVSLAESEFRARRFEAAAAVSRLARSNAADEPAAQRLLAHAGSWLRSETPSEDRKAGYHLAIAKAYQSLGDVDAARTEYLNALKFDEDLVEAHVGLSTIRMPGDHYLTWLDRIQATLTPYIYVEIGVAQGHSLCFARPPTVAIGVDPNPVINTPLKTETHIFCETSDEFFARERIRPLANGRPIDLAFIDGLHVFQQSLRDFVHIEKFCGPQSVILLHDTVPLDEVTQRPERQRKFYTGDVWKTVLCLKHYRPDLDIITVATPWTGLTMISGVNPSSRVLSDNYDEAVARFVDFPYSEIENRLEVTMNITPNDWDIVLPRLTARSSLRTTRS